MNEGKLTVQDYQDAITVQSACNLIGISNAFSEVMRRIRSTHPGMGTSGWNTHPLAQMYLWKMADLAGLQTNGSASALALCQEVVRTGHLPQFEDDSRTARTT